MLVDSNILPQCKATPGSFGGLMALYEANFIKLSELVDEFERAPRELVSRSPHDYDLYLTIEKRSRYTCDLRLTYRFPEDDHIVADPDLLVCVYTDARMAEVKGWINGERHRLLRLLSRQFGQELDHCWRRNIVFSKWLDYLLDKGHSFKSV